MPSRYTLYETEDLGARFSVSGGLLGNLKKRYNISPTQSAPVIVTRDGVRHIEMMKWGFIPKGAKDANSVFRYKTFNIRSEGIFEKPATRDAIRTSRCLVPSNGYFEWTTGADSKQPFLIHPTDQKLFSFAGICSTWQDPEGILWGTYSIITTIPSRDVETVNDRMPVILRASDESRWLNPEIDNMNALYDVMRSYPDGMLAIDKVGQGVNSTKIDNSQLIKSI